MIDTADLVTTSAHLQALAAAIVALAEPLAGGAAEPQTVAAAGLHIKTLADLARDTAEGLLCFA